MLLRAEIKWGPLGICVEKGRYDGKAEGERLEVERQKRDLFTVFGGDHRNLMSWDWYLSLFRSDRLFFLAAI